MNTQQKAALLEWMKAITDCVFKHGSDSSIALPSMCRAFESSLALGEEKEGKGDVASVKAQRESLVTTPRTFDECWNYYFGDPSHFHNLKPKDFFREGWNAHSIFWNPEHETDKSSSPAQEAVQVPKMEEGKHGDGKLQARDSEASNLSFESWEKSTFNAAPSDICRQWMKWAFHAAQKSAQKSAQKELERRNKEKSKK